MCGAELLPGQGLDQGYARGVYGEGWQAPLSREEEGAARRMFTRRHIGHGVGLRVPHYAEVLANGARGVDWYEVTPENFFRPGGRPWAVLDRARRDVPVALHGVALGVGNTDPISRAYVDALRRVIERVEPAWISDHLCWSAHRGRYAHDLWPLPYTEEALEHVASRVSVVQEWLGRAILL